MKKSSKIIVTIIVVVAFVVVFAAISGARTDAGHKTPGIFGLIVMAGMIGALRAVWKKNKDDDDKHKNDGVLQK